MERERDAARDIERQRERERERERERAKRTKVPWLTKGSWCFQERDNADSMQQISIKIYSFLAGFHPYIQCVDCVGT